jgi:hypothetical protein
MMRLWADFNDIEEDDYVVVDLDSSEIADGEDDLHVGTRVDLFDGGGHECQGEVVAVDLAKRLVGVRIDWATWHSPAQLSEPITMVLDTSTIILADESFNKDPFEGRRPLKIEQGAILANIS